ncbi:hypothetical protein IE53DRAFT_244506 [Violaceomyces palustris]|uniref:Uncharacterized protein n=1 Tax=Violaceomyces palustris TaxID=1673888 RepID=A0ACD0P423_9BASI|nr:hypothetical protein IE53DRAFT_244506 [Violaceomyces palustris]
MDIYVLLHFLAGLMMGVTRFSHSCDAMYPGRFLIKKKGGGAIRPTNQAETRLCLACPRAAPQLANAAPRPAK